MKIKTLFGIAFLAVSASLHAFSYDDITTWAGTGSNKVGFVVDWNDGVAPASLVWGFRWDGNATGLDLLNAVMTADPKLSRTMGGGGPNTIYGLGYDVDNDGFSITGTGDDAFATDPDDHYKAGWFSSGFWGYFNAAGTELPATWGWGDGGFMTGNLDADTWEGFSWAPAFDGTPPSMPVNAPVPEPATMAALGAGVLALLKRRR